MNWCHIFNKFSSLFLEEVNRKYSFIFLFKTFNDSFFFWHIFINSAIHEKGSELFNAEFLHRFFVSIFNTLIDFLAPCAASNLIRIWFDFFMLQWGPAWGEEGQPQQFLVRAIFSFSCLVAHLEILVLRLLSVFKFLNLEDKTIF